MEKPSAEVHVIQCLPCGFQVSSSWETDKQNQAGLSYIIGCTYPNYCVHMGDPWKNMHRTRILVAVVCWILTALGRLESSKKTHFWQRHCMQWAGEIWERSAWPFNKLSTRLEGWSWQNFQLLFGLLQCILGLSWTSDTLSHSQKRN